MVCPPSWISLYKHKRLQLRDLNNTLRTGRAGFLTAESYQSIEIHPMDFMTGEPRGMFQYFNPFAWNGFPEHDDDFPEFRKLRQKNKTTGTLSLKTALLQRFIKYSRDPVICDPGAWRSNL